MFIHNDGLYAARDPHGYRPLVVGEKDGATVFASETCALDAISAEYVREVKPGELIRVNDKGMESFRIAPSRDTYRCVFEILYFANPSSLLFDIDDCATMRVNLGKKLYDEAPVEADLIVPVLSSGQYAAEGYSEASGIPLRHGLFKNRFHTRRSFLQRKQLMRDDVVLNKLTPIKRWFKDNRVVLVDDTVMRFTTMKKMIEVVKGAGAKEVHVRIPAPPTTAPCFMGVDTPTREELIAASIEDRLGADGSEVPMEVIAEEVRKAGDVDSFAYLSHGGMLEALGVPGGWCTSCFTGNYGENYIQTLADSQRAFNKK